MAFDVAKVLADRHGENFELHSEFMNPQMPRVLRTEGFDRFYVRAEGCYLFDDRGERYLDMLSGFGVYALGRYHPGIKDALHQDLDLDGGLEQAAGGFAGEGFGIAYLEEAPFVTKAMANARGHVVAVIGYLANEGMHATKDLPGLIAEERIQRGMHWPPVHDLGSIGADEAMPRLIMDQVTTAM